ncbi:MAG TPA: hypothetical protein PKE51_13925, partial [Gemmatimonadaceae bacterium]|nr:hypothetical protein [Gemmatimonadaceae bacterium]
MPDAIPSPRSPALAFARIHRGRPVLGALLTGLALTAAFAATPLHAQTLAPRRTLTTGPAPGCDIAPATTDNNAPRNTAEARRLSAQGQEAALVGDQAAARDAFARAVQLNPADERLLYDLA